LHVSDDNTDVTGEYNPAPGEGYLGYEYSGARAGFYTGAGAVADSGLYFMVLRWHSGPALAPGNFSMHLRSQASSLPYRRGRGSGSSWRSIILEALSHDQGGGGRRLSRWAIAVGAVIAIGLILVTVDKIKGSYGRGRPQMPIDEPGPAHLQRGLSAADAVLLGTQTIKGVNIRSA
jgi:hypothetical protein